MNVKPDELMNDFLNFKPREAEEKASMAPSVFFQEISAKQALEAFHIASKQVPAYKDFLKINGISPEKIQTIEDFKKVPLTDKKNYLMKYPLKDLTFGGSYRGKSAITSSSGSSGVPLYWPRTPIQDFGACKGFDSFLVNTFEIDKISTFHMNCSGMGIWTSGDYVGLLIKYLSYKYPHNTSISPGIDLDSTIKLIEKISLDFEQTIIYSYPPFARDIVDSIPPKLIKKINLKFIVYGEPYSEKWRKFMLNKINGGNNYHYITSVLGSSEGGLIGTESRVCTLLRIIAQKRKRFCKALFGKEQVPSLIQYNSQSKYIESISNNLVLTNMGGVPLIRYDTHDSGGIIYKEDIISSCKQVGNCDLEDEAQVNKILITSFPFLYVFGRSDYTASIYGVLIYPEIVKDVLTSRPFAKYFSGKFVMSTEEDATSNQFLNIVLETKKNVDQKEIAVPPMEKLFADHIALYSSEYSKLLSSSGKRVYPKIEIRDYGDNEHFSSRNKQKYLI